MTHGSAVVGAQRRILRRRSGVFIASLAVIPALSTGAAAAGDGSASGAGGGGKAAGGQARQMLKVGPLYPEAIPVTAVGRGTGVGQQGHLRVSPTSVPVPSGTSCSSAPPGSGAATALAATPTPGAATIAGAPSPALPVYPGGFPAATANPATAPGSAAAPGSPPASVNAYDLVSSNGAVHNYGGAGFFGSAVHLRSGAPIVASTATPDGGGYWLVTTKGNLYNYGDAGFFGSPVHVRLRKPIVAVAATPDGRGYWLAAGSGAVYNFGDAPFCGSAVREHLTAPVVALAATPDGGGYWLVTASGSVYGYGDASKLAGATTRRLPAPVVAIAATPDGKGYWLVTTKGNLYNFGDAGFFGSPIHADFPRPVASLTSTADGKGYWVTTATGRVYDFGDAPFEGSLAHSPPRGRTKVVGLMLRPVPPPPPATLLGASGSSAPLGAAPWPHALFGYDISNFQCATPTTTTTTTTTTAPTTTTTTASTTASSSTATISAPTAVSPSLPDASAASILEVVGWLDSADNPCLAAEGAWATQAAGVSGAHYGLYVFLNSPGTSPSSQALDATGPGGTCASIPASLQSACIAYNYGFNGAQQAFAYAGSQGVSSPVWWLDIENATLSATSYSNFPTSYWSSSTTLNDETIEGAIDALRVEGVTVGLYGTSIQYATIAGPFVPARPQVPLWVAGVPWTNPPYSESGLPGTSVLGSWCAGTATYLSSTATDLFAGGVPWVLQETPGPEPSPYGLDPDYLC